MEWSVDSVSDKRFVAVQDVLVNRVIEAVDNPAGSFSLDPYKDYRLSLSRLPEVLDNLHKAIRDRRQMHHREVIELLHLRQWEEWALDTLKSTEQKDMLLMTLLKLEDLCFFALKEGRDILIFGD